MDKLLEDSNKNGIMSQVVQRIIGLEEYVRTHKGQNHISSSLLTNTFRVIYASNLRTTLSAPGTTTIFSFNLPANFFSAGGRQLRWTVNPYVDTTVTARNLTWALTLGATTATFVHAIGGSRKSMQTMTGFIARTGASAQVMSYHGQLTDYAVGGTGLLDGAMATPAEVDTAPITLTLTLALSGAVDFAYVYAVLVEEIYDCAVY
jgi:hypothetical protein